MIAGAEAVAASGGAVGADTETEVGITGDGVTGDGVTGDGVTGDGVTGILAWFVMGFASAAGVAVVVLPDGVGSVIKGFFDEQADKLAAITKISPQANLGKRRQGKSDICMGGFSSGFEFNWARVPKRYMIKQIPRF